MGHSHWFNECYYPSCVFENLWNRVVPHFITNHQWLTFFDAILFQLKNSYRLFIFRSYLYLQIWYDTKRTFLSNILRKHIYDLKLFDLYQSYKFMFLYVILINLLNVIGFSVFYHFLTINFDSILDVEEFFIKLVSLEVDSLWGDCTFIPADWGS